MSLQLSIINQNSGLVELSIEQQIEVVGGGGGSAGTPHPTALYKSDLDKYANGKAEIGSNGDMVTFTYGAGYAASPRGPEAISFDAFKVNGDKIELLQRIPSVGVGSD